MKKILSMDFAVVKSEEIRLMDHPTTIFTDDWVDVKLLKTKDKAIEEIKKIPIELFEALPEGLIILEPGKVYKKDFDLVVVSKEGKAEKI